MKSLIHYSFGGHLVLKNIEVTKNYMIEPSFSEKRALVLFCEDFYGKLDMN